MTPRDELTRRRELHNVGTEQLLRLYASRFGILVDEVRPMLAGLGDPRQFLVDVIVQREKRAAG